MRVFGYSPKFGLFGVVHNRSQKFGVVRNHSQMLTIRKFGIVHCCSGAFIIIRLCSSGNPCPIRGIIHIPNQLVKLVFLMLVSADMTSLNLFIGSVFIHDKTVLINSVRAHNNGYDKLKFTYDHWLARNLYSF